MSDDKQDAYDAGAVNDSRDPKQDWYRFWVYTIVIITAVTIIVLITFASGIAEYKDWVSFLTVNIVSILAFDMVLISALTAREMVEIMERQETEMTEQRKAVHAQVAQMIRQGETMQGQLDAMKLQGDLYSTQMDLMIRNECAYLGIKDWKVPLPEHSYLVVQATVFNGGRTPAWHMKRQFQVLTVPEDQPPDWKGVTWEKPTIDAEDSFIIAGGTTYFTTSPIEMKSDVWNELRTGKRVILVDGQFLYSDTAGRWWSYEFGATLYVHGEHARKPAVLERYQRHKEHQPN